MFDVDGPERVGQDAARSDALTGGDTMAKRKVVPPASQIASSNMFGRLGDLGNEASVERTFVDRLLGDLGYTDSQIKPKASIEELTVNLGRKTLMYRPDYAMEVRGKVRWVVDAKAIHENLDEFVGQCASYCLMIRVVAE